MQPQHGSLGRAVWYKTPLREANTKRIPTLKRAGVCQDRGEKFARFRQLASLREYVLVEQKEVHVERYLRQGTQWVPSEFRSLDDVLRLLSINCELPLREIYERVTFPNSGAQPRLDIL